MSDLEHQLRTSLEAIPTLSSSKDVVDALKNVYDIVMHKDTSSEKLLLQVALPFLRPLKDSDRGDDVTSTLLSLLDAGAAYAPTYQTELLHVATSLLGDRSASEQHLLTALRSVAQHLSACFQTLCDAKAESDDLSALWKAYMGMIDGVMTAVEKGPLELRLSNGTGRSDKVWLRAWKLLESLCLICMSAADATVYRDEARSNVKPDEWTIDRVPANHPILKKSELEGKGASITSCLMSRIQNDGMSGLYQLDRHEHCVAINSLSLLSALRPQLLDQLLPILLHCTSEAFPGFSDGVVQATLKANLIKLLALPPAQNFADEMTDVLFALGASERASRAVSKSKEPRRKYVSAPSETALRRARIRTRSVENEEENTQPWKRRRKYAPQDSSATSGSLTHDNLVNLPSASVVDLVLESFSSDMPSAPSNTNLELPPSELKSRMTSLLSKLATPSSAYAIETSAKRMQDPRRRKDPRLAQQVKPSLVPVFDSTSIDEVADWLSKNAATIAEPVISVAEDNTIQVHLKQTEEKWCKEMAMGALDRILQNEYGTSVSGHDSLREHVISRLAASEWFLSSHTTKIPSSYENVLNFVLEDVRKRSNLATNLFYQEYLRSQASTTTNDTVYRHMVRYFFDELSRVIDLSSASDRKLFASLVAKLPVVHVELLQVLTSLFDQQTGVTLAVAVLRDLTRDRKVAEKATLRLLLRYTCHPDSTTRNAPVRCVANQLYGFEALNGPIEEFAIHLVHSIQETKSEDQDMSIKNEPHDTPVDTSTYVGQQIQVAKEREEALEAELNTYAGTMQEKMNLSKALDSSEEVVRRLELFLALCVKKPSLFHHLVTAYGDAGATSQSAIFQATDKLIKLFGQRGNVAFLNHLHGFPPSSLDFMRHVIKILSIGRNLRLESGDADELVAQALQLYTAHSDIPNAASLLIPVLPGMNKKALYPLLPELVTLPDADEALNQLLEARPPQLVTPVDLLIALHDIDIRTDTKLQKPVVSAIDKCVSHRHAFPSDILLHVCGVLIGKDPVPKLALRTLMVTVQKYSTLKQDVATLLDTLVDRKVWEMEEALWTGFVKCAALVQPASFPMLLRLPKVQLENVLAEEKELSELLQEYITTEGVDVSDELKAVLGPIKVE